MSSKDTKSKQEILFNKEQILASKKYADKKDVCNTVVPDNFYGTLAEVDVLIEKFMKGKVN